MEYLLLLGVINNLHRKLGHNSRNCWHHHWVPPGIHFASMISRHGCCVDGGSTFNGHVSRCAEAAAHTLTWWMIWLLSIGQEQEWGGQARFYKMSAVDGSIANDDDLLGSYPPSLSSPRMLDWHGPHCPPDTSAVCNGRVARAKWGILSLLCYVIIRGAGCTTLVFLCFMNLKINFSFWPAWVGLYYWIVSVSVGGPQAHIGPRRHGIAAAHEAHVWRNMGQLRQAASETGILGTHFPSISMLWFRLKMFKCI